MKKLILLVLLLPAFIAASAQRIVSISVMKGSDAESASNVKYDILDKAYLECTYDLRYLKDTIDTGSKVTEDVMKLQVGPEYSRFYSQRTFMVDSMSIAERGTEVVGNIDKYRKGETYNIYKGNGALIFTDNIIDSRFRYEEPLEGQDWEISDETREILGYRCQRAECDFRGRRYTAWFTPEIPLNDGPWKFCGLPGLIMAVADDAGHYTFTATGIRPLDDTPVEYAQYRYHKIKRKEYLKLKRKATINVAEYMNAHSTSLRVEIDWNAPSDGMAVAEMNYDFMERDYH